MVRLIRCSFWLSACYVVHHRTRLSVCVCERADRKFGKPHPPAVQMVCTSANTWMKSFPLIGDAMAHQTLLRRTCVCAFLYAHTHDHFDEWRKRFGRLFGLFYTHSRIFFFHFVRPLLLRPYCHWFTALNEARWAWCVCEMKYLFSPVSKIHTQTHTHTQTADSHNTKI